MRENENIGKVYIGGVHMYVHRHVREKLLFLNKCLLSFCSRPGIVLGTWAALMELFLSVGDTHKYNESIV